VHFDARIDGQRQVRPMHQILANRMAPMLTGCDPRSD
jgi:hypothetical protein